MESVSPSTNRTKIAFIGFGEVGQRFSRDFLATGRVAIRAYDKAFGSPAGERLIAAAAALGVDVAHDPATAAAGADIVISAVTADQTLAAAGTAAGYLAPGQVFVDVNSAAPTTKCAAAETILPTGARYVECAVMAPVLKPGIRVPILAGGPAAEIVAARLNDLGMAVTPVAESYGRASAMKLCRSIVIKGLEALMVDCAAASARWGVEDQVFGSLGASYPSIDWRALAAEMGERVATHGIRRAAEMREAADMLAALDLAPDLARAVADAQQRGARKKT